LRARSIKPGLFKNEALGAADPLFTVVFEGLWCLADREGRLEDRPLRIHVEVNPYRDSASTVQALDWLVLQGFVTRYTHGDAKYLEIVAFRKHQQPHIKEAHSKIPPPQNQGVVVAPDKHGSSTEVAALTPSSLTPDSGLLTVGNAREPEKVSRGTFDGWSFIDQRLRPAYPRGTYRANAWITASRDVERLIEQGVEPDELVANAVAYQQQQEAEGNEGGKFVLSPVNWLANDNWRGPFPVSPTKAAKRMQENIDSTQVWLREQEERDRATN
jgi:hypothetical protein